MGPHPKHEDDVEGLISFAVAALNQKHAETIARLAAERAQERAAERSENGRLRGEIARLRKLLAEARGA